LERLAPFRSPYCTSTAEKLTEANVTDMFLMYVDESGDTGLVNSPTRYFALSGLVVHELRWQTCVDQLTEFRRNMRVRYGLKMRDEIHAVRFISRRPGELSRIPKHERMMILRLLMDELARMPDINIINVVIDKQGKSANYDVFDMAWKVLIQRFENTIRRRNFPGPANPDERGMIFPDRTDDKKLTKMARKMRRFNPIPNMAGVANPGYRQMALQTLIEDPVFTKSESSYLIQSVDVIAYFLQQLMNPNAYVRRAGARNLFLKLDPVLCHVASTTNAQGIVKL
jgi:Protein of unknown function (DUF3800)